MASAGIYYPDPGGLSPFTFTTSAPKGGFRGVRLHESSSAHQCLKWTRDAEMRERHESTVPPLI